MCLIPPTKLNRSRDWSRQFCVLKAFRKLSEDHFQFQPRQVRPKTEMLTDSEREMRVRIAADVELERSQDLFDGIFARVIDDRIRRHTGAPARDARDGIGPDYQSGTAKPCTRDGHEANGPEREDGSRSCR
jgi:hypothetical protein